MAYQDRIVDLDLDELLPALPAIAIEGAKGVGKTATARRRARTVIELDDLEQHQILTADPQWIDRLEAPLLIDEWQRHPPVWDLVRRSVDRDSTPGRFILTGSASPTSPPAHSGAGRIIRIMMRPMSLAERQVDVPTVSLARLLDGSQAAIEGSTSTTLPTYIDEITRSGFPGIRDLPPRARRAQLDGYLARIVEHDFPEQGHVVRRPATLRAWLEAYAAATATTASYNTVLDAATAGDSDKPAKTTTIAYRDILTQLWILEPLPGWLPVDNHLTRLTQAPKHHLVDPALAARLLALDSETLLDTASTRRNIQGRSMLGPLFEALMTLSLRIYAQAAEAQLHHLRTRGGEHEIDLIVTGRGGSVLPIEVKLAQTVDDRDVAHLHWLRDKLGDAVADAVVVTTGSHAYRRRDGIAVVPAALLGP